MVQYTLHPTPYYNNNTQQFKADCRDEPVSSQQSPSVT